MRLNNKLFLVVILALAIAIVPILSGCQHSSSQPPTSTVSETSTQSTPQNSGAASSPSPSSPNAAQQTLDAVISAMSHVRSFKMDSDVIDLYNTQEKSENYRGIDRWKGETLVDIPNKEMHLTMNIDQGIFPYPEYCVLGTNVYYDQGYAYQQSFTCYGGNTQGIWQKSKLPENIWNAETPISPLLDLLKSANQAILFSFRV